jgi:hypothetical protein
VEGQWRVSEREREYEPVPHTHNTEQHPHSGVKHPNAGLENPHPNAGKTKHPNAGLEKPTRMQVKQNTPMPA